MFDPKHTNLQWARDLLASLLDENELAAASRSTLNAHYTDPRIVAAMWDAVEGLGFTGGTVLEPGCGSGNFLATAPAGATMVGVELDPTTQRSRGPAAPACRSSRSRSRTCACLTACSTSWSATCRSPRSRCTTRRHNRSQHSIHNHFIIKALHLTRPGGLVAVLTSRYTLDSLDDAARCEMSALADLVTAFRLPSDAHLRNAGTRVVMDLLILRRREPDRTPCIGKGVADRHRRKIDAEMVPVNTFFARQPRPGARQAARRPRRLPGR